MNFSQAYSAFGPDVERIASETGIKPHEIDRLINEAMDIRYQRRKRDRQNRDALWEIRRRHA